jgi:hypothetical protein
MSRNFYSSAARYILLILLLTIVNTGCRTAETCVGQKQHGITTGPRGPRKLYVPEYYVYRNGRYEFVKGHYRYILSRKTYLKRSMRGFTNRLDETASFR